MIINRSGYRQREGEIKQRLKKKKGTKKKIIRMNSLMRVLFQLRAAEIALRLAPMGVGHGESATTEVRSKVVIK